ncbi:MAG: class I SAM-dependent methyltransferase [Actinomycetota bacterium]|nr:class I SAM-dependent methyltransferase [Actinomycetota bacterium]
MQTREMADDTDTRTDSAGSFARSLFTPLPKFYDLLETILSLGQNARWRGRMIEKVLQVHPSVVLDVATGTAGVAIQLCDDVERVVGIDITHAMVAIGKKRIADRGLADRISISIGDAQRLPFEDESFDALTFTYLLRYVQDPAATIAELGRVTKAGGRMASLEFSVPSNIFWRALWFVHTRLVLPLAGLPFGKGWFEVGRFLGPNIQAHYKRYPIDQHVQDWQRAGFDEVGIASMSLGGGLVMWGTKKGG